MADSSYDQSFQHVDTLEGSYSTRHSRMKSHVRRQPNHPISPPRPTTITPSHRHPVPAALCLTPTCITTTPSLHLVPPPPRLTILSRLAQSTKQLMPQHDHNMLSAEAPIPTFLNGPKYQAVIVLMRPSYIPFSETATSIFLPGSEHVSANPLRKIHQVAFMSKEIFTSFFWHRLMLST